MRIAAREKVDMQVKDGIGRESAGEFASKAGIEVAAFVARYVCAPFKAGATGEINRHLRQRLVHRKKEKTVTGDSRPVAKRLGERLAKADADVLNGVVGVHLGIAYCLDFEVEKGVPGEKGEHVIKKTDAGDNPAFSRTIKIEFEFDLGFGCLAVDRCRTFLHD